MFNLAQQDYTVAQGDRIAQLVLERIFTPPVVEVEDLDATTRGEGGFGSTGFHQKTEKRGAGEMVEESVKRINVNGS